MKLSLLLLPLLADCAAYSPRDVAPPDAITVTDAFAGVAAGIKRFRNDLGDEQIGMITCRIAIKFAIAASASQGGTVGGTVGTSNAYVEAKLSAEQKNGSDGNRSNTVEIILGSIYPVTCAPALGAAAPDTGKPAATAAKSGAKPSAAPAPPPGLFDPSKSPLLPLKPFLGKLGSAPEMARPPFDQTAMNRALEGTGLAIASLRINRSDQ